MASGTGAGPATGQDVSRTMTRMELEKWLLRHNFTQAPAGKTSHKQFVLGSCKVTVPGHGPKDLSKKHLGMILRLLESVGFDRVTVRREWGDV